MNKLISLCDHPWIQERRPKHINELRSYAGEKDGLVWDIVFSFTRGIIRRSDGSGCDLYLPLGFNPETGRSQLDELLMEAVGLISPANYGDYWSVQARFKCWLQNKTGKSIPINEGGAIWFDSMEEAKLTWLRELIEEVKDDSP